MTKRYDSEMSTTDTTYVYLNATFRKGLRNSNWRKLNYLDKALYRAAMWYAKHRIIVDAKLVEKLLAFIAKLLETSGARVFRRGLKKAVEMLDKGEGVFVWAPRLRDWLRDPAYIFWLGTVR